MIVTNYFLRLNHFDEYLSTFFVNCLHLMNSKIISLFCKNILVILLEKKLVYVFLTSFHGIFCCVLKLRNNYNSMSECGNKTLNDLSILRI